MDSKLRTDAEKITTQGFNLALSVFIDEPPDDGVGGQVITVNGRVTCMRSSDDPNEPEPGFPVISSVTEVRVRFGASAFQLATPTGPNNNWSSWTISRSVGSTAALRIEARAHANDPFAGEADASTHVDIEIDSTPPQLSINTIPDVTVPAPPYNASISGTASDLLAGIKKIDYRIGNSGSFITAARSGSNWSGNVTLPSLGSHTLTVRSFDKVDNLTTREKIITVRDNTPPTVTITSPPEGTLITWDEDAGQVVVKFTGTATDTQTGVDKVEWALGDQNIFTLATPTGPGGSWNTWSADVVLPSAQEHTVIIRARDGAGKMQPIQRRVTVIMPFEPPDPLDVVSLPSYLHDLLAFASGSNPFSTARIRKPDDSSISRADLSTAFHQPFAEIADPFYRSVANQLVHQNRICIEVLRGYLASFAVNVPAEVESTYAQTAYQSLLRNLGTSYDELRLVRAADAETRNALALRLGFRLSDTRPDTLDNLTLQLDQVNQADLERLFGLVDTRRDPLTSVDVPSAELLVKQLAHLRSLWLQQDDVQRSALGTFLPIIDPDLIGISDLKEDIAIIGNPVHDLLVERQEWVAERLEELAALRTDENTDLANFQAVIASVFGSIDVLNDLFASYQDGADITPQLKELQLELPPFLHLMHFGDLASNATVFDDEWNAVFSILTQVQKLRQADTWRTEERQQNLTLGPDYFGLTDATAPAPALPAWRATEGARQGWLDTLQARIEQEQTVRQSLQVTIDEAEDIALPLLRDALVALIDPVLDPDELSNRLTQELLIDTRSNDTQRISRVDQAIQTLQGALFGLRIGHFEALEPVREPLPTAGWKLSNSNDYTEAKFDEEWQWMGSYATWRSAMFVFGYPENYLLPTLRPVEDQTQAFADFVTAVRTSARLNPDQARIVADAYLKNLRNEFGNNLPDELKDTFKITDQLSDSELAARRGMVQDLFEAGNISEPHEIPNYLSEVFYFVPVLLATQLQQAGQFLAALDWLQSVYAFNFPVDGRRIYYGLTLETDIISAFARTDDWLLSGPDTHGLNAHKIVTKQATRRQYAYTRYVLMLLTRCFIEFADSEFTHDTNESLPRARTLYVTAFQLLNLPEMQHGDNQLFPPNPVVQSLRVHAELNLHKLRSGRNIAGLERQIEVDIPVNGLPVPGSDGTLTLPRPATLRPTPYRYAALIERAKQLVSIAQQVEAAFLAALEKRDAEAYNVLRARQDAQLGQAGVQLQNLRVLEARGGVEIAKLQRNRSSFQVSYYQRLLNEGLSLQEQLSLAALSASLTLPDSVGVSIGITGPSASVSFSPSGKLQTTSNILSTMASYERRKQEWYFQRNIALEDERIGEQQIVIANDHVAVVQQEQLIAQTQVRHANETIEFLQGKFTNVELYEWMSGVLGQVYSYFLQQATAVAQLAQNQLAFERQETPPSFIQSDYWQIVDQSASEAPDRLGLTGSARLLQDITRLDQHAFETNRRKLELSHTISLAQLAPAEFQRFRESGSIVFATPMELFDQAFPGHYLRLIKRVRTSVIALIPPFQGIHATLTSSGLSRVVSGSDLFQTTVIRRDPEQVALTSPSNATGLFELESKGELLLPFEGTGVDTVWEFQMPRASNAFDFNTIADVLINIDYTAFASPMYREQVIKQLDRTVSAERAFSFRQQFSDQWYDLHNPDQTATPLRVQFEIRREDFPPNIEELTIQHLLLYVARADGVNAELSIEHLHFIEQDGERVGGSAVTIDGVVSTRRSNGANWLPITGIRAPFGTWEVALPDTPEVRAHFAKEQFNDMLFVVTFRAQLPEWPT